MNVFAVVAAAGLSSRMGRFKPLLRLGDSTVIDHTVDGLRRVGAGRVVVVTGYQSAELEKHFTADDVILVKNERFAQTDMLTSIQLGLSVLPPETERVFATPADVPLVSLDTLEQMLAIPAQVVRPTYQGRGGHPLLLRKDAVELVLTWQGEGGLRGLLNTGTLEVKNLAVNDPGICMDADTPQDYQRLLDYQDKLRFQS